MEGINADHYTTNARCPESSKSIMINKLFIKYFFRFCNSLHFLIQYKLYWQYYKYIFLSAASIAKIFGCGSSLANVTMTFWLFWNKSLEESVIPNYGCSSDVSILFLSSTWVYSYGRCPISNTSTKDDWTIILILMSYANNVQT